MTKTSMLRGTVAGALALALVARVALADRRSAISRGGKRSSNFPVTFP